MKVLKCIWNVIRDTVTGIGEILWGANSDYRSHLVLGRQSHF